MAPALARSTPSRDDLPEGSAGMSPLCAVHVQMNWSKASSAADLLLPTRGRRLRSRCPAGRRDPCYGCRGFTHSRAQRPNITVCSKRGSLYWTAPDRREHTAVYVDNTVTQHFPSGEMATHFIEAGLEIVDCCYKVPIGSIRVGLISSHMAITDKASFI